MKKVEFFPDFPKRGLPWKALKLQGIFLASKNRFLSRLSKNETAVENIGKSKVNIENFENFKNERDLQRMALRRPRFCSTVQPAARRGQAPATPAEQPGGVGSGVGGELQRL